MELYSPLARTVCVTNENITSLNLCDVPPVFNITFPGIPTSPLPTTIATTTPSVSWSIQPERTTTRRSLPPGITLSTTILSTLSKFTTTESLSRLPTTSFPNSTGLNTGLIVGVSLGAFGFIVLCIALLSLLCNHSRNKNQKDANFPLTGVNVGDESLSGRSNTGLDSDDNGEGGVKPKCASSSDPAPTLNGKGFNKKKITLIDKIWRRKSCDNYVLGNKKSTTSSSPVTDSNATMAGTDISV